MSIQRTKETFSNENHRDFSRFNYPGGPSSHSETLFFNSKKELLSGYREGKGIPSMNLGRFSGKGIFLRF